MAISNQVARAFAEDPERAFQLVEQKITDRRRAAIPHLESLLEQIDHLIRDDPERAIDFSHRAIALTEEACLNPKGTDRATHPEWTDLHALALAVMGTAVSYTNQQERAVRIFEGLGRRKPSPRIRGSIQARHAISLMNLKRWREADMIATKSVRIYERQDTTPRPFTCLAMALLVRGVVGLTRYQYGAAGTDRLTAASIDMERAAALARELSFQDLRWAACNSLAQVVAIGAFDGLDFIEVKVPIVSPSSPWWPKARWTDALASCARHRCLIPRAERAFYEARDGFEHRGMVDEGTQLTLDLQWWLIASGKPRRAVTECDWIEHHLDGLRFDRDLVVAWISAIRRRALDTTLVQSVFAKVRGLANVDLPTPS